MLLQIIRNGEILQLDVSELKPGDIFVQRIYQSKLDMLKALYDNHTNDYKQKLVQDENIVVSEDIVVTRDEYIQLQEGGLQIKVTETRGEPNGECESEDSTK